MTRDITNRYRNLPQRTPQMLMQVVKKFYRGAISHYDFIQRKKEDVQRALSAMNESGDKTQLEQDLDVLFCEFHFYVTCWLQIELALYRLARQEGNECYKNILEKYQSTFQLHLHVRDCLDDTTRSVIAQREHFQDYTFIEKDRYWFDGKLFSVDEKSLSSLQQLYQEIISC